MADAYPMYDDEELVSSAPDSRNYKGIGIALLVIVIVCALIVTAVVLLTPPDTGPRVKNPRISLEELQTGEFQPNGFNGTWTSDTTIVYRNAEGALVLHDVLKRTTKLLVPSTTFRQYNIFSSDSYKISADQRHLLLAIDKKPKYRHSYDAKYKIYDIHKKHAYDLALPPSASSAKSPLQLATWGPRSSQLCVVWNNDLFYYSSVGSQPVRLTSDGVPGVVFNAIPDWVYEEEVLMSNKALWFSPSGEKLCFAKFNDSKVDVEPIPHYGAETDPKGNQYTRIEQLRYPKAGRPIPTVELFVFKTLPRDGDAAASPSGPAAATTAGNNREAATPVAVKPPPALRGREYYITIVSWVDDNQLLVNFLHRQQNTSTLAICSDQNKRNADFECTELKTITSSTGWVEMTQEPIYDADRLAFFIPLPLNDGRNGKYVHVAKINISNARTDFLTHGAFDIVSIKAYDKANKLLYLLSTREDAPGEQQLYRVRDERPDAADSATTVAECLTCHLSAPFNISDDTSSLADVPESNGSGDRSAATTECSFVDAHFSPTTDFFVRECLGPGVPAVELVAARNNSVVELMDANDKLRELVENRAMPQVRNFSVPLTDKYSAAVRLLLPPGLRDEEIIKYPMVVEVYAGPGSMSVQERFLVGWGHYLASRRGIIYATADVRGSSRQGERRKHAVFGRLGGVEVADQLAVVRQLVTQLRFVDAERVAVWGWSYGGYAAAMALARDVADPVLCCGIAVAPVSNWFYYDAVYTERYMKQPTANGGNLGGYEKADLTRQVENLSKKKFFLIHGTFDDNVHYQQSMMLAQALVKKNVLFQSLTYPDQKHQLDGVRPHLYKSMETFFDQCFQSNNAEEIGLMTVKSRDRR